MDIYATRGILGLLYLQIELSLSGVFGGVFPVQHDKTKYYEGICQFFKVAVEQHGMCRLLPGADEAPLKVQVAFLDGTKVLRLENGVVLPAKNLTAIGCIPKGDSGFQVQTLSKDVFIRNARKGGAALTL